MKLTIEKLERLNACNNGKEWFVKSGCKTVCATVKKLISEEKYEWANWILPRMMTKVQAVEYACFAARLVLDKFEVEYPEDLRPRKSIEVAEAWVKNPTEENRLAARSAAETALSAESAARSAAWSAESAARSAAESAESAARSAAWSAESAARSAAWSAAWSAARSAAYKKIILNGLKILKRGNK